MKGQHKGFFYTRSLYTNRGKNMATATTLQIRDLRGPYQGKRNLNKPSITVNVGSENVPIIESYRLAAGFGTTSALVRAALREYMRNHPVEQSEEV
jgi:hypothetical protein